MHGCMYGCMDVCMVTGGVWRCSRGVVKLCGKLVADGMMTVGVWQCSSGVWECSSGVRESQVQ
jgi:hypothetical protein